MRCPSPSTYDEFGSSQMCAIRTRDCATRAGRNQHPGEGAVPDGRKPGRSRECFLEERVVLAGTEEAEARDVHGLARAPVRSASGLHGLDEFDCTHSGSYPWPSRVGARADARRTERAVEWPLAQNRASLGELILGPLLVLLRHALWLARHAHLVQFNLRTQRGCCRPPITELGGRRGGGPRWLS